MKKELLEKITDLHDVGKKVATKKNIKGNYTSYNHDKIGEKIVNDILRNKLNYDGVVIKKIANSNFAYLNDDKYYLVDKTRTTDAGNFVDYYLEELGFTHENPLYTKTPSGYTFNGEDVDNVIILKEDYATLILVVKSTGTHYTYSVYNTDGTLLGNIEGISTYNSSITKLYFDDNNVVLKVDTKYVTLNR